MRKFKIVNKPPPIEELIKQLRKLNPVVDGVHQEKHPNGQLSKEWTTVDGKREGIMRLYHQNGKLAEEIPFKNDKVDGLVRQWSTAGKFLGEFELKNGQGIQRKWNDDGSLDSEIEKPTQNSLRIKNWYGSFGVHEAFMWNGKNVSKKKFLEKLSQDEEGKLYLQKHLARYEGKSELKIKLPSAKYRRRKSPVSEKERTSHEKNIAEFLASPNQAEALQWLACKYERTVGEMTTEATREMIEEGYVAGAKKIIAVNFEMDAKGNASTNHLIVELPTDLPKRKRVFEWSNELSLSSGHDPEDDWGQTELFMFFD